MRVLVVDDCEPIRRLLSSILRNRPEFQVIREVADGLEAVQESADLQPDLVLLDIGLPELNGIEAARRIVKVSPTSKILFVSQESSPAVVREALRSGASGFVVKTYAGRDLLAAVDAVSRGEQFVSNEIIQPLKVLNAEFASRHEVGFYSDECRFLDGLTQFIVTALKSGGAAIVVATEPHRESLLPRLQSSGLDVGAAIDEGRYVALDAVDALSTFMADNMPDPVLLLKRMGDLIVAAHAAKGKQARVALFGECAHLLWTQGKAEAAIQIEKLGNQLTKRYDVDILCAYSLGSFQSTEDSYNLQRICAEHSAVHYGPSTGA
jgi:DNA-binding NarL/FixJ family response regulator